MSDIRKLIKEIDGGINLKKNLPLYGKELADSYLNYAAVELTFSAYLLVEMILESDKVSEPERGIYAKELELLGKLLSDEEANLRQVISEAKEIREQITKIMEVYTSYTDRLICYDYALKRMRLKFSSDKKLLKEVNAMNEEEFLMRLMRFVVGNEDKSVVRERLQMLMGQLPVYITKNKLLERVSETLTLYQGSDVSALEGFVYMIRSAAMLHSPDESMVSEKEITDFLGQLEQTDFSELDAKAYEELSATMEQISAKIMNSTDIYYSLQKVTNGMIALCLARLHNQEKAETFEVCKEILAEIQKEKLDDESLVKLEGKIETYVEKTSYLEAVLFQTKSSCGNVLEELGLATQFEDSAVIANLLSDSLFIDIDKVNEEAIVDADMVKNVTEELTEELSVMLSSLQRPVKKAAMAAVLEKIPVSFSNTQEIEAYIRTNLFGCQNISEKGVVMLELEEMMSEADSWSERKE